MLNRCRITNNLVLLNNIDFIRYDNRRICRKSIGGIVMISEMINCSTIIAACLLILLSVHEVRFLKSVVIKSNRSKFEISAVCFGMVGLLVITILYGKNWSHYFVFVCCGVFILADVYKQGISEAGLLIVERGKELYKWNEIHHAEITVTDKVRVVYFKKQDSVLATHFYEIDSYENIIELFQRHNIQYIG